jgi:hypothetical protein
VGTRSTTGLPVAAAWSRSYSSPPWPVHVALRGYRLRDARHALRGAGPVLGAGRRNVRGRRGPGTWRVVAEGIGASQAIVDSRTTARVVARWPAEGGSLRHPSPPPTRSRTSRARTPSPSSTRASCWGCRHA